MGRPERGRRGDGKSCHSNADESSEAERGRVCRPQRAASSAEQCCTVSIISRSSLALLCFGLRGSTRLATILFFSSTRLELGSCSSLLLKGSRRALLVNPRVYFTSSSAASRLALFLARVALVLTLATATRLGSHSLAARALRHFSTRLFCTVTFCIRTVLYCTVLPSYSHVRLTPVASLCCLTPAVAASRVLLVFVFITHGRNSLPRMAAVVQVPPSSSPVNTVSRLSHPHSESPPPARADVLN